MSNPEREQFNPEPTGEQYEKKEKAPEVQKVIDKYKEYEKIVQEIKEKEEKVTELRKLIHLAKKSRQERGQKQYKYSAFERVIKEKTKEKTKEILNLQDKGDELWETIPDVFLGTSSFDEVYERIQEIGGQMYSMDAKRTSAKETIRNIEKIREDLKIKKRKELFLKMDDETKEIIFFCSFSRSGGLRNKVMELIEQETMEKTVDPAEIPKTGEKVERLESKTEEGAETAEREQ